MGAAAGQAQAQWNESHTQVKITVSTELASSFKKACEASNTSITAALARFMVDFCGAAPQGGIGNQTEDCSTLRKRRTAAKHAILLLEQMRLAEERFIGNAPENLQDAPMYEAAAERISALEDIIDQLGEFY
jgi:hypothetical protein